MLLSMLMRSDQIEAQTQHAALQVKRQRNDNISTETQNALVYRDAADMFSLIACFATSVMLCVCSVLTCLATFTDYPLHVSHSSVPITLLSTLLTGVGGAPAQGPRPARARRGQRPHRPADGFHSPDGRLRRSAAGAVWSGHVGAGTLADAGTVHGSINNQICNPSNHFHRTHYLKLIGPV